MAVETASSTTTAPPATTNPTGTDDDRVRRMSELPEDLERESAAEGVNPLGTLNRHWYRRCLDQLDSLLRQGGAYPSVEELRRLCGRTITAFLTAATAQAPDSNYMQFPADRAYFIPFEDDIAGRFNFAKPVYQLTNKVDGQGERNADKTAYEGSIWSFCPWGPAADMVRIARSSVNAQSLTISFEEMISVREFFKMEDRSRDEWPIRSLLSLKGTADPARTGEDRGSTEQNGTQVRKSAESATLPQGTKLRLLLRKSLLLRRQGEQEEDLLALAFGTRPGLKDDARKAAEKFVDELQTHINITLVHLFEIYREAPGNAGVELLLLQHVHLLNWMRELLDDHPKYGDPIRTNRQDRKEELRERVLPQREDIYSGLFNRFLHSYFLDEIGAKENDLARLKDMLRTPDESKSDLLELVLRCGQSHFLREVKREWPLLDTESLWNQLRELVPFIDTFRDVFLQPKREEGLERELVASLGEEFRGSSDGKRSFVWVCTDFEDIQLSLPRQHTVRKAGEVKAQRCARQLNRAYVTLFRRLDAASLAWVGQEGGSRSGALKDYWRALGQVNRGLEPERPKPRLFASFEADKVAGAAREDLGIPIDDLARLPAARDDRTDTLKLPAYDLSSAKDPRPQNFFLRVCISDSLGEPIINGLFVFTTDHDEYRFKGKKHATREEDLNDLLAFAKVYFFTIRNYFIGLDQSREAREIGRLNQYLYDERLAKLDKVMTDRAATKPFVENGITDDAVWDKFLHEILNQYSASLIEKPRAIKIETFAYDRLLVLPLADSGGDTPYSLPFHLFQAIFAERKKGRIDGTHYSLIRPFQSPVEKKQKDAGERETDAASVEQRFTLRTFQSVTEIDGDEVPMPEFLEKHYLGADPPLTEDQERRRRENRREDFEPQTFVPRNPESMLGEERSGKDWAVEVVRAFWCRTRSDAEFWKEFLQRLTEDHRKVKERREDEKKRKRTAELSDVERAEEYSFWLRFGLLRLVHRFRPRDVGSTATWTDLTREYEAMLELRFDGDETISVLKLLDVNPDEWFRMLRRKPIEDSREMRAGDEERKDERKEEEEQAIRRHLSFVPFALIGNEHRFVVEFLRQLTLHVINEGAGADRPAPTWYQPLLTRPVDDRRRSRNGPSSDESVHVLAAQAVGDRTPDYSKLLSGEEGIQVLLGLVNLRVGETDRESRRISLLIAMIRDYDPARAREFDDEEGRRQAETAALEQRTDDCRDLTLFTRSYFQNAAKFVENSMQEKRVDTLSVDITQIARNWYSGGIDAILERIQNAMQNQILSDGDRELDRLLPEVVDGFVGAVLDVLLRQEKKAGGKGLIKLESFPFDRFLHVPLAPAVSPAVLLGHARTRIVGSPESRWATEREKIKEKQTVRGTSATERLDWDYETIRELGRVWDSMDGRKEAAGPVRYHAPGAGSARDNAAIFLTPDGKLSPLSESLLKLAGRLDRMDELVRALYEAQTLETLAQAGLLCHLMRCLAAAVREGTGTNESVPLLDKARRDVLTSAADKFWGVLDNRIRILERADVSPSVLTDALVVERNGLASIASFVEEKDRGRNAAALGVRRLIGYRDLFEAAEPKSWKYGLGEETEGAAGVHSKVFYIYYSIQAPSGFRDVFVRESRYRGVFCLIVDDADTDPKDVKAQNTDREDIRTLIHNSAGHLRLVLQLQELSYERKKPGAEQSIIGMLHRLKNELSPPRNTLQEVRNELEPIEKGTQPPHAISPERATTLTRKVVSAMESMEGIEETFQQLKNVGERRDWQLLELLSSDWLGWVLLDKLSAAAVRSLTNARSATGIAGSPEEQSVVQEIERLIKDEIRPTYNPQKNWADLLKKTVEEPERVRLQLRRLQALLERVLRVRTGKSDLQIYLTYEVYSPTPLHVLGGRMLVEALNILIENAFQALWGYVHNRSTELQSASFKVVCRTDPSRKGEVLVEIRNSSLPINTILLETLQSDVPQPVTRRVHAEGSRKKGGSGFGHYFARRVIADLCGGQKKRRRLDARIEEDRSRQLVTVRVNLLDGDVIEEPRKLPLAQVIEEMGNIFKEHAAARPICGSEKDARLLLPGDIELRQLLRVAWDVLWADRRIRQEEARSVLEDSVRRDLNRAAEKLSAALLQALEAARTRGIEYGRPAEAARLIGSLREQSDFSDSALWYAVFAGWLKENAAACNELLNLTDASTGTEDALTPLREPFRRVLGDGTLRPIVLLSDAQQQKYVKRFAAFDSCFRTPIADPGQFAVLLDELDREEGGRHASILALVERRFKEPLWNCTWELTSEHLVLVFRMSDGNPGTDLRLERVTKDDLAKLDADKDLGRAFLMFARQLGQFGELTFERAIPSGPNGVRSRAVRIQLRRGPDASSAG